MPSAIVQRTLGGQSQNAIQMINSGWARSISLPQTWNHIRLGMRYHMTDPGSDADLTGGAFFYMGFCNGTSGQVTDTLTPHFVGIQIGDAVTPWHHQNLVTPCGYTLYYPYAGGSAKIWAAVKIGSVTSLSASGLVQGGYLQYFGAGAASNFADRNIFFFDLFKGNPNYQFYLPFQLTGGNFCDFSSADFLNFMIQPNPLPSLPGYLALGTPGVVLPVDETTNGVLNAVNFAWSRADALFEICDVAVAVIA